jgi:hypothetical protein
MEYKKYAVFMALLILTSCELGGTYTLYRNSTTNENMRIHVATFDAAEGNDYNSANCDIAKNLFASQDGVKVRYWCEKGGYKK